MSGHFISDQEIADHFISDQKIAGHFISDQKIAGLEKARIFSNMNGIYLVRTNQFHCILNTPMVSHIVSNRSQSNVHVIKIVIDMI